MSFTDFLIHVATIYYPVESTSGTYQVTMTLRDDGEDVPVRLEQLGGQVRTSIVGRFPTATHLMYVEGSKTVEQNDEITIEDVTDRKYRVISVADGVQLSSTPHHKECILEEVYN
jgi:hypothetical protein